MGIFRDYAPLYWSAGLQAIPLYPEKKAPTVNDWSRWNHERLTDGVKETWLDRYEDGNIGVVPGPISNVCFVDLDIYDVELLAKVEAILPPSPWRRVGAKGCVLAYEWCDTKSFKIFEKEGTFAGRQKIGVEFFSSSGQVVMPPSIHPDTHQPYVANCNLWEVTHKLCRIDGPELEKRIREVLKLSGVKPEVRGAAKLTAGATKGTRDVTMIRLAGLYALGVRKGELNVMEALEHMDVWASELVEEIEGDPIDITKGKERFAEYLVKDVREKQIILPKGWDNGLDPEIRIQLGLDAITAEDVSLDFEQILGGFRERMVEIETEKKGRGEQLQAVDKVLMQAARSKSISPLEIDGLLNDVQDIIGKGVLKMSALRKGLKQHQIVGIAGESHSEIAEDVIRQLGDVEMRYDRDTLWEWYGSYWKRKEKDELLRYIAQNYGNMPAARRHSDHQGIYKTVCSLVAKPLKTACTFGINFTNGFLGTDMRMVTHDREYGLTYELPYEYHPDVRLPTKFIGFLSRSFAGDQEMIDSVQEALAVTMFQMAPKFQRCFLFYGVPHSGKSVFMDIIESLFPTEARTSIAPNLWNERFMKAQLAGPLLNLAGELPEKMNIEGQIFKQVVNGEPIAGEHKNQAVFTFRPTPAHWFASNHLPRTQDVSAAFIRRWLIYPFDHAVPEAERDINLADDIVSTEKEAIVAWAAQALERVIARGHLAVPKVVAARLMELGAILNPVRTWFEDKVRLESGGDVPEEVAYLSYSTFALMKGYRKLERGLFRATMREMAGASTWSCVSLANGNQQYLGIKLLKTA